MSKGRIVKKHFSNEVLDEPVSCIIESKAFAIVTLSMEGNQVKASFFYSVDPDKNVNEAFKAAIKQLTEHNKDFQRIILNK